MIVFTLFFGRLAGIKAPDAIPYPLFSLTGLVLWTYFANAVTFTSNSLVGNAALITKVYFPRLAIAVSPVLAGLVDFLLAASVLGAVMGWYGYAPPLRILLAPCFLLLAMLTALGVGLWLSALNVRYRDVRYVVPFLMQIWLFATPVAYPASKVHGKLHTIYGINPMAGVVEGFRWAVLGKGHVGWMLAVSGATSVLLVVTGALYFSRTERAFADVIPPRYSGAGAREGPPPPAPRRLPPDAARREPPPPGGPPAPQRAPPRLTPRRRARARQDPPRLPASPPPRPKRRLGLSSPPPRTAGPPVLGAEGRRLRGRARRGGRHHRPQRRGQEHAAEDPLAHHRAHRRARCGSAAGSARCSRSAPASTPS